MASTLKETPLLAEEIVLSSQFLCQNGAVASANMKWLLVIYGKVARRNPQKTARLFLAVFIHFLATGTAWLVLL